MLSDVRTRVSRPLKVVMPMLAALCLAHSAVADDAVSAVQLHAKGHGWLLSDTKGMSLYVFAKDQDPGKSSCNQACAKVWPPYLATAQDKASGEWSIITRDDQTLQWAYRGKPLYDFSRDVTPGDTNGDGNAAGAWTVAFKEIPKPPGVQIVRTLKGWVLADNKGMSLYASDSDAAKKTPSCDVACTRAWKPMRASWLAVSEGDWSVVNRSDGTKQWAYKDHPLYSYVKDGVSEDTLGDGAAKGWHVVVLEPPPPVPKWTTVQAADDSDIYGDRTGITIYVHDTNNVRKRPVGGAAPAKDDDGGMMRPQDWKPVLATADDKAIGDWSIVVRDNGNRQWAYKGLLLYTNINDAKPGEINGHRRDDLTFRVVTVSGKPMNGTGA